MMAVLMSLTAGLAIGSMPMAASAALKLQFRADVGVEKAAGVPAAVSDTVLNWLDQSGNSNMATQAVESKKQDNHG